MKQYFLIPLMAFVSIVCKAQSNKVSFTGENFETEFLSYQPIQRTNVSSKKYNWSIEVISETKKSLLNNGKNYFGAHYWNILTAFDFLEEDTDLLKLVFIKLANSKGGCEYITSYKDMVKFDDKIPELYTQYYKSCANEQKNEKKFNIDKYITKNKLNNELVKLINKIDINDQKYRSEDEQKFKTKQPELDIQNQKIIDSLFAEYEKYIGKSLVGKKFEYVMWSVIQHSNPDMMEKYLPIVQKAVENNELEKTPLKMLVDRFYGLKYGYQIFGSQNGFGFKMADEQTRKAIIKKYKIE